MFDPIQTTRDKLPPGVKDDLYEQTVLFASVLKWFALATLVGVLVGLATTAFLQGLAAALAWTARVQHSWFVFLLLPLGMLTSTSLVRTFAPEARGHGTEKVIEAVHTSYGRIPPMVVPVKLVATIVTLACGGSAGKEGPCAQIGAGICSLFADIFRFKDLDRRKLVICGVSAGFATVFGTPIAGALFAVEVLSVGQIQYQILFPSFVAGVTGFQVAKMLGGTYFAHPVSLHFAFSEKQFVEVAFAGVVFGLCAYLFIALTRGVSRISHRFHAHPYLRALGGGAILSVVMLFSTRYVGLGLDFTESLLEGTASAHWYDPWMKMIATTVTLGFGGSGGILTPIFFIGSSLGNLLGQLFHMQPGFFAALGFIGFLSGCANTPIAASVMAMELFGTEIGVFAAMVSIISFLMTGHRSVYPSQVLAMRKSDSLDITLGQPFVPAQKEPD
ncbi:MAG: chloride channel protein [Candidatus Melainabacteria bacterium]